MINIAGQLHAATGEGILANAGEINDPILGRQDTVNRELNSEVYGSISFTDTNLGEDVTATRYSKGNITQSETTYLCFVTETGARYYVTAIENGAYVYNYVESSFIQCGVISACVTPVRGSGGGGGSFDPNGTYPNLTAGGLIARESDAVIDLRKSFIFRTAGGDASIGTGAAKTTSLFGNIVDGVPFNPTHFQSIGFNAFNPDNVMSKAIASDGSIAASEDHKVAYIHVVAGQTGVGRNNGYIISSKESDTLLVNRVAFVAANPTEATTSTVLTATAIDQTRNAYIPPTEGYLLIDCYNAQLSDMCVHLAWSYNPQNWKEYHESVIELPTVHDWGMGKAGSVMDEIDFLSQSVTIRVDRSLLSGLTWSENRTAGSNAYSDTELTTIAGEVLAVTENTITVGATTYTRDSEHDTLTAYAWTADEVTIYTANDAPSAPTYTYSTDGLQSSIKASTTNLYVHGLPSSYNFTVGATGTLTLSTGATQIVPTTALSGIYLYYELATEVIRPETLNPMYDVDDFGTEEFIGTAVAPTYATFFYLPNMYDDLRRLLNQDQADHTRTIDFGEVRQTFTHRNIVADMTIKNVVCDNVASLMIYVNSTLKETLNSVVDGTETTVNIKVLKGDSVTLEITRHTENEYAQVNYSFQY